MLKCVFYTPIHTVHRDPKVRQAVVCLSHRPNMNRTKRRGSGVVYVYSENADDAGSCAAAGCFAHHLTACSHEADYTTNK